MENYYARSVWMDMNRMGVMGHNRAEPLVSVVIPTYNRADTIARAVGSVLNQTVGGLEIIVVDDGSEDGTPLVMERFAGRVKYVQLKQNSGANHARNVGIEMSEGTYIAFQDSDNVWESRKLERQIACMAKNGADAVCCRYQKYVKGKKTKNSVDDFPSGRYGIAQLLENPVFDTSCLLGHRTVFAQNKFDEAFPRLQDYELSIRMVNNGVQVYLMDEILVDVFVQSDSISMDSRKLIDAEQMLMAKYGGLFEKYPKAKAAHLMRLIRAKALMGLDCAYECKELYELDRSVNNGIKFLFAKCGLLKVYYKAFNSI